MQPQLYQERDEAIETFDEQLHQLSFFTPTDDIKEQIQRVRDEWATYKKIAGWSIKKDAASKLLKQAIDILQATKALHNAYVDYQKTQLTASPSNSSLSIKQYLKQNNNQRILIERVIMYYLAEKQGIDATASGHQLHDAERTFSRILKILEEAKITSTAIQKKLDIVREDWDKISEHLIFVNKDQSYIPDMLQRAARIATTIVDVESIYLDLSVKLSLSYTLNEATTQSICIQKITKAYIASGYTPMAFKYKKEVSEYVDDFEKRMNIMAANAPTEQVKNSVKVVKTMWKNYKTLVEDIDNTDELHALKVLEQCHVVAAACDRVSEEIRNYAQSIPAYKALSYENGELVDPSLDITQQIYTASDLQIYTERIILYTMMKMRNLDVQVSDERLKDCVQNFEAKFKELEQSRLNSNAMNILLKSCATEWDWIKDGTKGTEVEDIDSMLEYSHLLVRKLTKLSNLYEHKMNSFFAEDLDESGTPISKK